MRKILEAPEGYCYTDGESYAKVVYLAEGDNGSGWAKIRESEMPKMESEDDGRS